MKWISTKDRLPVSKDSPVLAFSLETGSMETIQIKGNFDCIASCDEGGKLPPWYHISQKLPIGCPYPTTNY